MVIAVLDDEEQMRKALRRLLSSHGFQVESFATAAYLLKPVDETLLVDAIRRVL